MRDDIFQDPVGASKQDPRVEHGVAIDAAEDIFSLVSPPDFHDPEARIGAARRLLEQSILLLDGKDDPPLPGNFAMPGQAIVITGTGGPLVDAPYGQGMVAHDHENVFIRLWYGTSVDVDKAMVELAGKILDAQESAAMEEGGTAQHVLAKWRHPDINRAMLGLFVGGTIEPHDVDLSLFEGLPVRALQYADEPISPAVAGDLLTPLGLPTDELVAAFDVLLSIALDPEDRVELMEIMEQLHPSALAVVMDTNLRQEWTRRMAFAR